MYALMRQTLINKTVSRLVAAKSVTVVGKNNYFLTAKVLKKMEDKESIKQRLTPLQYHITQEAGTERPFSGCYNKCYEAGTYVCIVCRQELFSSNTKYDSGCGWPAFNDVLAKERVTLHKDTSTVGANILLVLTRPGLVRTEVRCAKCSAHLGHVFDDGPAPTKKRFCINSASMDFLPAAIDAKSNDS